MNDTPRTDDAELDNAHFADQGCGPSGYVEADFARDLERELATAKAALEAVTNELAIIWHNIGQTAQNRHVIAAREALAKIK